MPKILLLEDDIVLLESLCDELMEEGYSVDCAKHGKELLDFTYENNYNLYLLDIHVPFIDGVTLLQELRDSGDTTPTIFLTSKNSQQDTINGFQAGCDDYLVKPFSLAELKLRIQALLKRTMQTPSLQYDDIFIDMHHYTLQIAGVDTPIDPKALEILHLFLSHPNTTLTTQEIIDKVYVDKVPSATVIRVHISKINTLFDTKRVKNIRGVGYRYEKS